MSSFHERQKDLFKQLKDAEEQISFSKSNKVTNAPDYSIVDRRSYRKLKHEMKQFRGKESIFKRESANIKQCLRAKTIPDHVKNPNRWAYYNLSDVTPDQMSDATNTATALALIQKMEENETQDEMDVDTDSTGAIFKKPTFKVSKTIRAPPADEDKPVIKSNKIIMPEYIVGVSKKKENKDKTKKSKQNLNIVNKPVLKLNHLYEEDDDE